MGFYVMLEVDFQPLGKSKREGLHRLQEVPQSRSWVGRVTCAGVWGGLPYQGAGLSIAYIRLVTGVGGVPVAAASAVPFSLFSPLLWFNKPFKILRSGAPSLRMHKADSISGI